MLYIIHNNVAMCDLCAALDSGRRCVRTQWVPKLCHLCILGTPTRQLGNHLGVLANHRPLAELASANGAFSADLEDF